MLLLLLVQRVWRLVGRELKQGGVLVLVVGVDWVESGVLVVKVVMTRQGASEVGLHGHQRGQKDASNRRG